MKTKVRRRIKRYSCSTTYLELPTSFTQGDECHYCSGCVPTENAQELSNSQIAFEDNHNYDLYHAIYSDEYVPTVEYDAEIQRLADGPYRAPEFGYSTYTYRESDDYHKDHDLMLPILELLSERTLSNSGIYRALVQNNTIPERGRGKVMKNRVGLATYYLKHANLIQYFGGSNYTLTEYGGEFLTMSKSEAIAKLKVVYDRLYESRLDL